MGITLGDNQYGKAETRLVRVTRHGGPRGQHEIKDLTVSISLAGDLAGTHLTGDNSAVVTTDTQKNTVFAFAADEPPGEVEDFALRLARHFVDDYPSITRSRVDIEEYAWGRIDAGGAPHPHAFFRTGAERRTARVSYADGRPHVVSGLCDLVVLKSAGSEFYGFVQDGYTTLAETTDRILATAVTARWRHAEPAADWAKSFADARQRLLETFATRPSKSLQQTLYAMGSAVLEGDDFIAEIRLSMPNKHHFAVDLGPFGRENRNEVFFAADRPYGLIEGSVVRDDLPADESAW